MVIIPAILTNNLSDFKRKLKNVKKISKWLHLDVMDGKFVNNISIDPLDLKGIDLPKNLEIHLMTISPQNYFEDCKNLKAKRVIFHLEATKEPSKILKEMKKYSFERGLALNPKTKLEKIKPYVKDLNCVLLLGVNPGFQGQKFQYHVIEKIKKAKKFLNKIKIGIDGGVNLENIGLLAKEKPDFIVVGSYLMKSKNIKKAFLKLKRKLNES